MAREIKNRLLITYRQMTPDLHNLLESLGEVAQYFTHIRLIVLSCDPDNGDSIKAALSNHPDVDRVAFDAYTDFEMRAYAPTDKATEALDNQLIYESIRAYEGWEIQRGRPDVIGGVSDTGVDVNHPDLAAAVLSGGVLDSAYTAGVTMYAEPPYSVNPYLVLGSNNKWLNKYFVVIDKYRAVAAGTEEIVPIYADQARMIPLTQPVQITSTSQVFWVNQECAVKVYFSGTSGTHAFSNLLCSNRHSDTDGHGTAVASGMVSAHGTGEGVQGIAPDCKIYALQRGTTSSQIAGFTFAEANGIDVVNCSWGVSLPDSNLVSAVNHAVSVGIAVVAASGNNSSDSPTTLDPATFPDNVSGVIAVSGTGMFGDYHRKAWFAERKEYVFISAPAVGGSWTQPTPKSRATAADGSGTYATLPWATSGMEGTSFAAPIVAGAIMLMLSEWKGRGLYLSRTPERLAAIKQCLKESANPRILASVGTTTYDTTTLNASGVPVGGMGFGLLDVARTLRAAQSAIDVRASLPYDTTAINQNTPIEVDVRTWGTGIQAVELYADDVLVQTVTPGGTQYTATLNATFTTTGSKKLHVVATDTNGSVSTSAPRYVVAEDAVKPVVSFHHYGTTQTSNNNYSGSDLNWPVVIYAGRQFKVDLASTLGKPLTITKLEVLIDGALKATITQNYVAPSTYVALTIPDMSGVSYGFHALTLKAYAGTVVTERTVDMVYITSAAGPSVFAKPYTYDANGVMKLCVYMGAGTATEMPLEYSDEYAITDAYLTLNGKTYATVPYVGYNLDRYHEFVLRVPKPAEVKAVCNFQITTLFEGEVSTSGGVVNVAPVVPEAAGNSPSQDKNPPITLASRSDGWYPDGYQVKLLSYDSPAPTIRYRWDAGEWQTYSAPLDMQTGTLEWYGEDAAGNAELLQSAVYEVAPPPPGAIAAAAVSLTPLVAAPSLAGVSVGIISAASVSLTPTVAVGTLSGSAATVGSMSAASVSLRPSVSTATLSGVQVGSMSVPAVTLRPSVAVGTLSGIEAVSVGSIAAASTTMQIQVNPPTLRGVTAGTAIRAPDGSDWDLRDIYGVPLDIRAVA